MIFRYGILAVWLLVCGFWYSPAQAYRWYDPQGRLTVTGQQAVELLRHAASEGLPAGHYPLPGEGGSLQQRDDRLSESLQRYVYEVTYGVTPPERLEKIALGHEPPDRGRLMDFLSRHPDLMVLHASLLPGRPEYLGLRQALYRYRLLARSGGWPRWESGPTLRPGAVDGRLGRLAALLQQTGDLSGRADVSRLSGELLAAVQRFQQRHGLTPDGVLGPRTQAALATPVEARIGQIIASMERLRWLPSPLGERYLLVNVPAQMLYAFAHGHSVLAMKVVVGRPSRPTPIFSNRITSLVVNPTWSVPTSIAEKDLAGKIARDPNYLTRHGFTVLEEGGEEGYGGYDAYAYGGYAYGRDGYGAYGNAYRPAAAPRQRRYVQKAGAMNALGKIKFLLPDNAAIYLHDTPEKGLFNRDSRWMSSGCIRVEKPKELTAFLLHSSPQSLRQVEDWWQGSATRSLTLPEETPVHLVYWTAWVDGGGVLHFREDGYGQDAPLLAKLRN